MMPHATLPSGDIRDGQVSANGLAFHYREWGDPDAPPLLICHGITSHSRTWDDTAASLAERFHVFALDQRGHGASDWAEGYAPEVMAEDIAALAAALGIERASIVGHSMGGINSLLCAARHPELVERLALIDIGPETIGSERVRTELPASLLARSQASFADPNEAVAAYLGTQPSQSERRGRFVLDNIVERADGRWVWRFDGAGLRSFVLDAPPPDALWAALRAITCPVLVIRATNGDALSAATASRMIEELPDGRLVEIAHSGHDVHIDQPAALVEALRGFLLTGSSSTRS
jgi:esterase